MNQVLSENERLLAQAIDKDIVKTVVNLSVNASGETVTECQKCLELETELSIKDFVDKKTYDKLCKCFKTLEKHCITLEADSQLNQEIFQQEKSVLNQNAPGFTQLFELSKLKAQSQAKDTVIVKLKEQIKSLNGNLVEIHSKWTWMKFETRNNRIEHRVTKTWLLIMSYETNYTQLYDSINQNSSNQKNNVDALIKQVTLSNTKNDRILQTPSSNLKNKVEAHPRNVKSSLNKRNGTVKGYAVVQNLKKQDNSDYVCINVMIALSSMGMVNYFKVYYVEGLGHNLIFYRTLPVFQSRRSKKPHKPNQGPPIKKHSIAAYGSVGANAVSRVSNGKKYILMDPMHGLKKPSVRIKQFKGTELTRANPPVSTPFVPPRESDWDLLFQQMYLIPEVPSDAINFIRRYSYNCASHHQMPVQTLSNPKNYKEALTQHWIKAMQDGTVKNFEAYWRFELVPPPDKSNIVISLKDLYKQRTYSGTKSMSMICIFAASTPELSPRDIFLNQSKYALESLKKYGYESCDPVDTPMVEKSKLDEDKEG
ncbi:hypothetical protein Tco_1556976 [Tanacetum coccineum]